MGHHSSHCKTVAGLGLKPSFFSSKFAVFPFSFPMLPTRLVCLFLYRRPAVYLEADPPGLGPIACTNRCPEGESFLFFNSANITDHCVGRVPRWSPKTPGLWPLEPRSLALVCPVWFMWGLKADRKADWRMGVVSAPICSG